jgi:prepilin peptidase CpaA
MQELTARLIVFLLGVGGFTLAAAVCDARTRRIPNKLTVPAFLAGLVFQVAFNGWAGVAGVGGAGLGSALLAFLVGFGTFFVLWLIGGGGGGDVKLMGALSVWLGFRMTLSVVIASTLIVVAATVGIMAWSALTRGTRKTKEKYVATGKPMNRKMKHQPETVAQKQQRRVMAYAVPVAVATWGVVLWHLRSLIG